jgi:predicted O-methyltransferase YrrM
MAVGDGGKVHYTDGSRKNADEARRYFDQARVADLIEVHVGDAVELLSERKEEFDILFCDIDKPDYPRVARQAAPRVRRGGLFVADNTLWRGLVAYGAGNPKLENTAEPDRNAKAMVEFNRILYSSPDWFTTILPLRDGVTVAMKK